MRFHSRWFALLLAASLTGCLYLPPMNHTAGVRTVVSLAPGQETHATLRQKLGRPGLLELDSAQCWGWRQNYGSALVDLKGGLSLEGKEFRVLARFDGDRAQDLEVQVEPARPAAGQVIPAPLRSLAWNPAPAVVCAGDGRFYAVDGDGALWRQEADGSGPVRLFQPQDHPRGSQALAWSESGHVVAVAGKCAVYVWDTLEDRLAMRFDGRGKDWAIPQRAARAEFSPDGRWLAVTGWGSGNGTLLLDTRTREPVWRDRDNDTTALGFSPDGRRFLVLASRRLRIIDPGTGASTGGIELPAPGLSALECLFRDFRVDEAGDLLLADGAFLTRWDLGEVERTFREEHRNVRTTGGGKEPALLEARMLPIFDRPGDAVERLSQASCLTALFSRDGAFLLIRHGWLFHHEPFLRADALRLGFLSDAFQVIRVEDGRGVASWRVASPALGVIPLEFTAGGGLVGIRVDPGRRSFMQHPDITFNLWDLDLDRILPSPEPEP